MRVREDHCQTDAERGDDKDGNPQVFDRLDKGGQQQQQGRGHGYQRGSIENSEIKPASREDGGIENEAMNKNGSEAKHQGLVTLATRIQYAPHQL